MRAELVLLCICTLLRAPSVAAQSEAQVPVDVETVASGGYWEVNDSTRGRFRVVIETGGYEHIISTARVDWLAEPPESDAATKLVGSAAMPDEVTSAGVHLLSPTFSLDGKQWILTIDAANTHCDPVRIDRWRVALSAPGKLTVLGSMPVKSGGD